MVPNAKSKPEKSVKHVPKALSYQNDRGIIKTPHDFSLLCLLKYREALCFLRRLTTLGSMVAFYATNFLLTVSADSFRCSRFEQYGKAIRETQLFFEFC